MLKAWLKKNDGQSGAHPDYKPLLSGEQRCRDRWPRFPPFPQQEPGAADRAAPPPAALPVSHRSPGTEGSCLLPRGRPVSPGPPSPLIQTVGTRTLQLTEVTLKAGDSDTEWPCSARRLREARREVRGVKCGGRCAASSVGQKPGLGARRQKPLHCHPLGRILDRENSRDRHSLHGGGLQGGGGR